MDYIHSHGLEPLTRCYVGPCHHGMAHARVADGR